MSAKAALASPLSVARGSGNRPAAALSLSVATARPPPSTSSARMDRASGWAPHGCPRAASPGGRTPRGPASAWQPARDSACWGLAIRRRPGGRKSGGHCLQAAPGWRETSRAPTPLGQPRPRRAALATPPGTPGQCPPRADREPSGWEAPWRWQPWAPWHSTAPAAVDACTAARPSRPGCERGERRAPRKIAATFPRDRAERRWLCRGCSWGQRGACRPAAPATACAPPCLDHWSPAGPLNAPGPFAAARPPGHRGHTPACARRSPPGTRQERRRPARCTCAGRAPTRDSACGPLRLPQGS